MGPPIRITLLTPLINVMNREQRIKLQDAIENGETTTTGFTPVEFRDLVNKYVMLRLAKRMKKINKK